MSIVWIEPLCLQNRASSRKVSERVIDMSDKTAYFYYSSIHQTNKVLLETPRFFTLNNIVTWTFCMKWIRRSDLTKNYIAFLIFFTCAGVSFIRSVFFFFPSFLVFLLISEHLRKFIYETFMNLTVALNVFIYLVKHYRLQRFCWINNILFDLTRILTCVVHH